MGEEAGFIRQADPCFSERHSLITDVDSSTAASVRVLYLRNHLARCAHSYYTLDAPIISDGEYDAFIRELKGLEDDFPEFRSADSPTQTVGGKVLEGFGQVAHSTPMLSIENAMDEAEMASFVSRAAKELGVSADEICFAIDPKFDGLSCAIRYSHGLMVLAATRGDGATGEDVTAQVRTIRNLPLILDEPLSIEIRGEVLMEKADFLAVNEALIAAGKKPLVNPRNGAAGALRNLDPAITASRRLKFFGYAIVRPAEVDRTIQTQSDVMRTLDRLGFETSPESRLVIGASGIRDAYAQFMDARASLPFDVDGMVCKVNSLADQDRLGWTSSTPRWAIAYKLPAEEASSTVKEIVVQVGRTGSLTPVAKIEPVFVGGVTVSSVTLHNIDQIRAKDIRVGDVVFVRRAGDVIPEITRSVAELREHPLPEFEMPSSCPVCGSSVTRADGKADHRCSGGLRCGDQKVYRLEHFCSRKAMNIDGIAEQTLRLLVEEGLVSKPSDFYRIQHEQLAALPGLGEASASNIIKAIQGSTNPDLHRFIYALGIDGVGESTAKDLSSTFGTWEAFVKADSSQLLAVPGVGPTTATGIKDFFADESSAAESARLASIVVPAAVSRTSRDLLAGKIFVLTGTLPTLSRDQAKEMIERAGGRISGSVSKKTTAVIAGAEAGTKLSKATELGVTVLDERSFLAMLDGAG